MRNLAVVQARMGSSRLPGKVLLNIGEKSLLSIVLERLSKSKNISEIIVATSTQTLDNPIADACKAAGNLVWRGSENDVLSRFAGAAQEYSADNILRITADCPLVDATLIDSLYENFCEGNFDHAGIATGAGALNLKELRFPDGLDAEWIKSSVLLRANAEATSPLDREHVTPYIWRQRDLFRTFVLNCDSDLGHFNFTVDVLEDFKLFTYAYEIFGEKLYNLSYIDFANWMKESKLEVKVSSNLNSGAYEVFYE